MGAEPGDDNTQCCSPYVKMAIAFSQIKNQHIATVAFGMPKTNQLTSFFLYLSSFSRISVLCKVHNFTVQVRFFLSLELALNMDRCADLKFYCDSDNVNFSLKLNHLKGVCHEIFDL